MNTVNCLNPDIIINPRANYFALKYSTIVLGTTRQGTPIYVHLNPVQQQFYYYSFPWGKYNPHKLGITKETGDNYYFLDEETGETEPLYMLVPCGECTICVDSAQQQWAKRAIAECQTHEDRPYFFTLTYQDKYLPKDGVNKDDIQKFLKRLRFNLEHDGYDNRFRYMITSEYGQDPRYTRRAHYHGIIFGLAIPEEYNHNQIQKEEFVQAQINRAWRRETPHAKVVSWTNLRSKQEHNKVVYSYTYEQIGRTDLQMIKKNSGSFYYTFKYVGKKNEVPQGKNSNFFLTSRGNEGGIGASFIDSYRSYLEEYPEATEIKFREKFSLKEETMPLIRYFRNRIFPNATSQIPKVFRDSVKRYSYNTQIRYAKLQHDEGWFKSAREEIIDNQNQKFFKNLTEKTLGLIQIPILSKISYNARKDWNLVTNLRVPELKDKFDEEVRDQIKQDKEIIEHYLKILNFKRIKQIQTKRDISIASAVANAPVQEDLEIKARKIEIKWQMQKSREKC